MIKIKIKITAIILTILILGSFIASCSGGNSNTDETNVTKGNETVATDSKREYPDIPDLDLQGFTLHFLAREQGQRDAYVESQNGDPVNDAVFLRNQTLMEKYNFNIQGTFTTDPYNTPAAVVYPIILADENLYQVVYDGLTFLANLTVEKCLIDLYGLKYIDYNKPWWDMSSNKDLSIANKLFFTYGEHMLGPKSALCCTFFNKKMAEDYDLGDLYQYVRDDNWNWDVFYGLAKDVYVDVNGNGIVDKEDIFGFLTEEYNAYTAMVGGGIKMTEKDKNDLPYMSLNSEKTMLGIDKMIRIFTDKTVAYYQSDISGTSDFWGEVWRDGFAQNQILFREGAMHDVASLRNMDSDFGILPLPKLFPDQERYYHTVSVFNCQMLSIPVTARDTDKIAFILEAMACESMYTLTPAYYDQQLKTKVARDEESQDMLDIIFDSKSFDIGAVYGWGNFMFIFIEIAFARTNKFASLYAAAEDKAIAAMEETIELILQIK